MDGCGSPSSPDPPGVPTSTVRYYERVGLMALPARTASGYRDYDEDAAARLLFITRARRMGLSCEQITALIPVWAGTNCGAAHDRVGRLIEEKQAEIAERIAELEQFSAQLDAVRAALEAESAAAGLPGRPHLLRARVGGRAGRDRAQPSPLSRPIAQSCADQPSVAAVSRSSTAAIARRSPASAMASPWSPPRPEVNTVAT